MTKVSLTLAEEMHLAETAQERWEGYVRKSNANPLIRAALRRRFDDPEPETPIGTTVDGWTLVHRQRVDRKSLNGTALQIESSNVTNNRPG